jgi:hypothetical protein
LETDARFIFTQLTYSTLSTNQPYIPATHNVLPNFSASYLLIFPSLLTHSAFPLPPLQPHSLCIAISNGETSAFIPGFGQQGVLGNGAGTMLHGFVARVQIFQERVAHPVEMLLMGSSQIVWNLNQQGIFFPGLLKVPDTCPTISASSPERLLQPGLHFLLRVRSAVRA